ncbi:MAG: hypothetical protein GX348_08990 [Veillonellaceae bacterium]|jgi:hypothetical protein|nr:hypothetical protein [Veillonellaceae bacterium]
MLEKTILLIAILIISYLIGKRIGYKEGFVQGKADAVLIMRQESFEQGYCTLCNTGSTFSCEEGCITTDPSTHNT